ncbi:MAG: tRNA (adenine-N1)-methyltransferase [Desulfurococcales archaeon]|nr:tRNA (adenine-N1)-methyltransferase [Desulfurococcales archaeon]
MREGDLVLLYVDSRRSKLFKAVRGVRVSTDKGSLNADDVLGLPWGSKVKLSTGVEAYVLKPTLNDILMKGFRRVTQVVYPKDISFVINLLSIAPGSKVLESGVGTGFMTAALAYHVGASGKVFGYEVREDFARTALRNLRLAGLDDRVDIKVRDIREGVDESGLDAAFLDLPDPWEALQEVRKALRPSSPAVIFTPSANQVMKSLRALRSGPFLDLRVYEVILREYQADPEALRPRTLGVMHTGYVVFFRVV